MDSNEKLYKFIHPDSNDELLSFNKTDLCKLFDLINFSDLELRDKLNIDKFVTFGMEIESEKADVKKIEDSIKKLNIKKEWIVGTDISLDKGVEVKSPIMVDKEDTWKEVNYVCGAMKKDSSIKNNAGGHVHVGAQVLGDNLESWVNFIKLWGVYENIIFRFSSGEFLTHRPHIYRYAEPVAEYFLKRYNKLSSKEKTLYFLLHNFECQEDRDFAVNLTNVAYNDPNTLKNRNTIEFRCPNGTLSPTVWQNNVNLFVKMLNYSKSSKYDSDTIKRRYKIIKIQKLGLSDYNEIYLNQMLEFCDLVFDNNIDKIYFLKQYLKSFEVYNGRDDYVKTKRRIFME